MTGNSARHDPSRVKAEKKKRDILHVEPLGAQRLGDQQAVMEAERQLAEERAEAAAEASTARKERQRAEEAQAAGTYTVRFGNELLYPHTVFFRSQKPARHRNKPCSTLCRFPKARLL
eukprot:COSAG05_NODE_942_length_6503_cov_11.183948_6_plen_118_part_00